MVNQALSPLNAFPGEKQLKFRLLLHELIQLYNAAIHDQYVFPIKKDLQERLSETQTETEQIKEDIAIIHRYEYVLLHKYFFV